MHKLSIVVLASVALTLGAGCGGGAEDAADTTIPTKAPEVYEWLGDHGVQCVDLSGTGVFDADNQMCLVSPDSTTEGPGVMVAAGVDSIQITFGVEYLDPDEGDSRVVAEHFSELFDWPAGTATRMLNTRALDGTQEAGGVSWTYHPDDGIEAVIVP